MGTTDISYWIGRWERGETGWHEPQVMSELVDAWSGLSPTRVFVPLCGKSRDLAWLAEQGHEVVGVEASAQACEEFFRDSSLPFQDSRLGPFRKLAAPRITLLQGDFFDLRPEHVGPITRVYDRGALIALPRATRARYAARMKELLPAGKILELLIERDPSDEDGPPHSVTEQELRALYEPTFHVRRLSEELLGTDAATGVRKLHKVYELTAP
jgi:thiopurine S-methyltransferase